MWSNSNFLQLLIIFRHLNKFISRYNPISVKNLRNWQTTTICMCDIQIVSRILFSIGSNESISHGFENDKSFHNICVSNCGWVGRWYIVLSIRFERKILGAAKYYNKHITSKVRITIILIVFFIQDIIELYF